MKKLLLLLLCVPLIGVGQGWEKTYRPSGNQCDGGISVHQTFDGGYIFCMSGAETYNNYIYLIKVNNQGDSLWSKTFGNGDGYNEAYSVQQTIDGGYVLCGRKLNSTAISNKSWLIKTDSSGNIVWDKIFGGTDTTSQQSSVWVQQTTDGGYILAGLKINNINTDWRTHLIKTNSIGDTIWTKTFVEGGGGYCVQQTTDGGYIVVGIKGTFPNKDVYLIKTDINGDSLFTQTFGGTENDVGISVQQTTDGGYIITGYTSSFGNGEDDVYIIKTDGNGIEQWNKTFGGTENDGGFSVQQTTDGGYIIAGLKHDGIAAFEGYLIKTDVNGDSLWTKTFGGTSLAIFYCVQQTTDGGYIIAGKKVSLNNLYCDVLLIKTDGNGNVTSEFTIPINPNRELEKVVDILGRDINPEKNKPFIEIYNDGTVEKKIIIE